MHFLFYGKKTTPEKIKEATFKLLSQNGYAALSMRSIAKEAGIAVGQVTYHYKTKEQLVTSVIDDVVQGSLDELSKTLDKSDDKIQAIISYFENLFNENVDVLKILIDLVSQALWNKKIKQKLIKLSDDITSMVNEKLVDSQDENEIKVKERFLLGTIYGLAVDKVLTLDQDEEDKNIKYGTRLLDILNIKNLMSKNEGKND